MVVADCGVEISGPLSARDYKDPGTDGLNKISAKMVPVIQEIVGTLCADAHPGGYSGQDAYRGRLVPTYAIQGSMIGRNDNAGPQGDGINVEVCFTQNTTDRHAVAQPISIQDVRPVEKAQNGKGWNDDGAAYTVDTHATQGVAQPIIGGVDYENNAHGPDDVTGPLLKGSPTGGGRPLPAIALHSMAVRRLTPVECERLQGFPDGYTNIPWRKSAESPDGPRYKALGNSWAVPVVRWIGQRIQDQINVA
jgi:DNA (cytosine-5)-methyltransferase 1